MYVSVTPENWMLDGKRAAAAPAEQDRTETGAAARPF